MQHTRWVCIREIQKDLKQSVHQLLVDKIQQFGLGSSFEVLDNEIRGPRDSLIIFKGMQSYNADSIKSLEAYDGAWVAEAQTMSQRSLDLLRPTIRKEGSEIWFDWNPENEDDPVNQFFRGSRPRPNSIVVEANWQNNPWFPEVLRQEMMDDFAADPAKYDHVWGGAYKAAPKGAYYAELLARARAEGRITTGLYDPIAEVRPAFDLGNGPNMACWFLQFVRREIRVIDYLQGDEEAASEGWPWYIRKLREKRYSYGQIILPHDARAKQRNTGKGDEQTLIEAKFKTCVVDRMDPAERVKLVQRHIPMMWFDGEKCAEGLKALKAYQADYDEKNRVDRGPLHNWASHPADGLGHGVQAYEVPRDKPAGGSGPPPTGPHGWMS